MDFQMRPARLVACFVLVNPCVARIERNPIRNDSGQWDDVLSLADQDERQKQDTRGESQVHAIVPAGSQSVRIPLLLERGQGCWDRHPSR